MMGRQPCCRGLQWVGLALALLAALAGLPAAVAENTVPVCPTAKWQVRSSQGQPPWGDTGRWRCLGQEPGTRGLVFKAAVAPHLVQAGEMLGSPAGAQSQTVACRLACSREGIRGGQGAVARGTMEVAQGSGVEAAFHPPAASCRPQPRVERTKSTGWRGRWRAPTAQHTLAQMRRRRQRQPSRQLRRGSKFLWLRNRHAMLLPLLLRTGRSSKTATHPSSCPLRGAGRSGVITPRTRCCPPSSSPWCSWASSSPRAPSSSSGGWEGSRGGGEGGKGGRPGVAAPALLGVMP